jgi:hypothetical protein
MRVTARCGQKCSHKSERHCDNTDSQRTFVVLTGFAVPLLASIAVRELIAPSTQSKSKIGRGTAGLGLLFLLLIFFIIWFAHRHPWAHEELSMTTLNGLTRGLFLILILGVLFGLSRFTQKRIQLLLGLGFTLVVWFDLITHAPSQNPTVDRSAYSGPLPVLQELEPIPKVGESRAMQSLKAHTELQKNLLSDPFNTFILQRGALYAGPASGSAGV